MKLFFLALMLFGLVWSEPAPLRNPGFTGAEEFLVKNYLNDKVGFVTATVVIRPVTENKIRNYYLTSQEGAFYKTLVKFGGKNLETIYQKRYDPSGKLLESAEITANNRTYLFNNEKKINKYYADADRDYYYRYGFFISFRGFPFQQKQEIFFKTLLWEYPAGPLVMRLRKVDKQEVTVPAGTFLCYKLELSVAGWQGSFSRDKWYFYYTVKPPHYFVKFDQLLSNGQWSSNELLWHNVLNQQTDFPKNINKHKLFDQN